MIKYIYELPVNNCQVTSNQTTVAIKQGEESSPEAEAMFRRESEILSVMRTVDHAHLIKAIAAYQIQGEENENYFVFPWGDGNLREFWKKESDNHGSEGMTKWALKQIHGLASSLKTLHGRLRPEG